MASGYRPSMDSALSPILSPTASPADLSTAYPPRAASARPSYGRRPSVAGSVVSFTSSVGTAADWRTSTDFGSFLAASAGGAAANSSSISALLDAPGARTSNVTRPKQGEIPPVKLSQIPKLKPSAFAQYLALAPEYERYLRAKDQGLEEHIKSSKASIGGAVSPTPSVAGTEDGVSRIGSSPRRRGRRGTLSAAPLTSVPAVYFDANFHLENPRTFDVVSDRSDVIKSTAPVRDDESESSVVSSQRKALATNAILQEKLSWYMDTVEVHLIQSISTASSSFFAALGDLRELHSEASASVGKIQALRKELVRLDEQQAVKGLEIVRLRRRRGNLGKLQRAVKQMEQVIASVQRVEKSLEHQEIETALEAVHTTERLLCGSGPRDEGLIDLRGVRALDAVNADLNLLRYRVGKAYEARFVETLLTDLRDHVVKVAQNETLRRWAQSFQREQYQRSISAKQRNSLQPPLRSSSLPPEYGILPPVLRTALLKHLDGLQRADHVNAAVQAYRDAVIREAKNLIRKQLPNDDDADSVMSSTSRRSRAGGPRASAQDKSQALTRALRALGPADAEDLLVRIYTGASELIRRLGTQQKMLLDVTMQMGETGVGGMLSPRLEQNGFIPNGDEPPSPSQESLASMDISDLISSAVEIAQTNIVKVVKVRTEQVARYPPDMFLRYFTLNRLFAQECEAVSVRVGSGLQNTMTTQIKEFLAVYKDERMRALADGLEKDRWGAKEFEEWRQAGVDRIMAAATADPDEWLAQTRLWAIRAEETSPTTPTPPSLPPPADGATPAPNGTTTTTDEPKKRTHAFVGESKFILPESGLLVLQEIESYLRLATTLPDSLVPDLASSLIDFLRLFNSRTFQLILGAGATRSAGLKSITTKHLAMASQALSIIVALIPYIRECVRRHVPAGSSSASVAEFDKLKRTTQEYQYEIRDKLISIMSDRARTHANTMKNIRWDEPRREGAEREGQKPYYMDTLCRETNVLYKVLGRHLPVEELVGILKPVFADYRSRLVEGYSAGTVTTEAGKQRMIDDVQTFISRLNHLEGFSTTGEVILEAVRNKLVQPPPRNATQDLANQLNGTAPAGLGLDVPGLEFEAGVGPRGEKLNGAGPPVGRARSPMGTPRGGGSRQGSRQGSRAGTPVGTPVREIGGFALPGNGPSGSGVNGGGRGNEG